MSANTLVRIFAETDFDEMKRMYCYSCYLMPGECKAQFKSFGNESKAKKDIRVHLEKHVDELMRTQRTDFTAEPILARKRRIKDLTSFVSTRPQVAAKRGRGVLIKEEEGVEKENIEIVNGKRKKEDVVPLLAEVTNDQELKRYRIKAEGMEEMEEEDEEEMTREDKEEMSERNRRGGSEDEEQRRSLEVKVERAERREGRQHPGGVGGGGGGGGEDNVHVAIDEDHCYAFKPGRVKVGSPIFFASRHKFTIIFL